MSRITLKRVGTFIGVMLAVAFVVYLPHYGRQQRQVQIALQQEHAAETQAAAQKAVQDAAARHAQFLARYVDSTLAKNLPRR